MMLSSPDIAPINHTHHRLPETVLRYTGNIVVTEDGPNTARCSIVALRYYGGFKQCLCSTHPTWVASTRCPSLRACVAWRLSCQTSKTNKINFFFFQPVVPVLSPSTGVVWARFRFKFWVRMCTPRGQPVTYHMWP